MTLRRVASKLDISAQYLSDIELGRRRAPGTVLVAKHAAVLGLEEDMLQGLAFLTRRVVELKIQGIEETPKGKLAEVLARRWDGLSQAEAEKLLSDLESGGTGL